MHKNCNTCRHWELIPQDPNAKEAGPKQGQCLRFPPTGYPLMLAPKIAGQPPQMAVNTVWPITQENNHCGEYANAAA